MICLSKFGHYEKLLTKSSLKFTHHSQNLVLISGETFLKDQNINKIGFAQKITRMDWLSEVREIVRLIFHFLGKSWKKVKYFLLVILSFGKMQLIA